MTTSPVFRRLLHFAMSPAAIEFSIWNESHRRRFSLTWLFTDDPFVESISYVVAKKKVFSFSFFFFNNQRNVESDKLVSRRIERKTSNKTNADQQERERERDAVIGGNGTQNGGTEVGWPYGE